MTIPTAGWKQIKGPTDSASQSKHHVVDDVLESQVLCKQEGGKNYDAFEG